MRRKIVERNKIKTWICFVNKWNEQRKEREIEAKGKKTKERNNDRKKEIGKERKK